jgi:hypothetical protein
MAAGQTLEDQMSFVSKGEKKVRNMAKKAGPGADKAPAKDSFGKKGDGHRSGAAHNMAPGSKDKTATPVTEDAGSAEGYADEATAKKSEYDPASGKRAKSVADLRNAAKLLTERSDAGEASPVGKEGGQEGVHGTTKTATGFMKAGKSAMDKKAMKKPRGLASQDADEMTDPMDTDEVESDQSEEGMTPQGKSRKKASKSVKAMMKAAETAG